MFGETRDLTDEEILAVLERTNLPTIVIEGKGDLFLFRRVQKRIGAASLSLLPVGGRNRVLFAHDNQKADADRVPVLYFTDLDEWLFAGVPPQYVNDSFYHTEGYSIENDLLRDGEAFDLLEPREAAAFKQELAKYIGWFALQISRYIAGAPAPIAKFPGRILDDQTEYIADCTLAAGEAAPTALEQRIASNPAKHVRGKSLMQILLRQLAKAGRTAKHRSEALLESGAQREGLLFTRVIEWVADRVN